MKNIIPFLEQLKSKSVSAPVTCLKSTSDSGYSLLFFSRVIDYLKKKQHISIQAVDFQGSSNQQILGQLETSFLGTATSCWLRDISALSTREQSFWYEYCARYTGPNTLLFFTKQDKTKYTYSSTVALPATVNERLFMQFTSFFDRELSVSNKRFIKK